MSNELLDELDKVKIDDVTQQLAQIIRDYKNPKFSTRAPLPFVFNTDGTPLEQENCVIDYFFDNWAPKKKNIYKIAKRIYAQTPRFIQRSILDHIMDGSVDPVQFMLACFDEKAEWAKIMKELLDKGDHGMIDHDSKVYGVNLNTNPRWLNDKQQKRWHPDDEWAIMKEAVDLWEKEHGVENFSGKIMLFPEYGFSGMPRKL